MAQQFAAFASSLVEGETRSKPKKDNSLVSRLEEKAVNAIGAKLLSGDNPNNSRNVGHLVNKLSSWNQEKRGYLPKKSMANDGYDNEWSANSRGGYGYTDTRTDGNYGDGSGWSGAPSTNRRYGQGYYDNGNYDGYGNRVRMMNDAYNGSYDNPPMSRGGGYGYA